MARTGDLFRHEAIAAAQENYGAPVRTYRLTNGVLTVFMCAVFCLALMFLLTNRYVRKETVSGVLEPAAGVLRVSAPRSAVVTELFVREGDHVAAGAPLVTLALDPMIEGGERGQKTLDVDAPRSTWTFGPNATIPYSPARLLNSSAS